MHSVSSHVDFTSQIGRHLVATEMPRQFTKRAVSSDLAALELVDPSASNALVRPRADCCVPLGRTLREENEIRLEVSRSLGVQAIARIERARELRATAQALLVESRLVRAAGRELWRGRTTESA